MKEKKALKEIIKEAGSNGNFTCDLCMALDNEGCDGGPWSTVCTEAVAALLLEAIDREYIERPRFEDGEPVKVGDEFRLSVDSVEDEPHTVENFTLFSDGSFNVGFGNDYSSTFDVGGRLKRPFPRVVGADRKPIKVGETVYAVGYDRFEGPCEVTELKVGGFATVRWNDNSSGAVMASRLTHECPDTLERIQQDAKKHYCEYWGCGDDHCANCHVLIDGKTPADHYKTRDCINAMMQDLLARQRKVLERDAR